MKTEHHETQHYETPRDETKNDETQHMKRIAIVHDYFIQSGGAERVAEALCAIYPEAAVFATVALPDRLTPELRQARVQTSWMQKLPGMLRYYRHYFLFYPSAVESLRLENYDVIISSSSGYAKGVKRGPHAVHICYCHTPMRWAWSSASYLHRRGPIAKAVISTALGRLRNWDSRAAQRPDYYLTNSRTVAGRIRNIYNRHAEVIPPPVNVNRFAPSTATGDFYLVLSRLIAYKQIDLAVSACTELGKRLIVIGEGPELERLRSMAGPTVEFLGRQPDAVVSDYARRCKALLFPGEEDFGIAPLEINAAGRPVIAYRAGGALETVVEGVSGVFFDQPASASLADAIVRCEKQVWNREAIRKHALRFDEHVFAARVRVFVDQVTASPVFPGAFC
jgi:glycosyltransferase involved in cell wall biosynthesis